MSIYDPHIFFDQIEKKFGRNQGAYQFGFDAIPSGRYFGGVLSTLAGLGLSGVPVGTGIDRRDIQRTGVQLPPVDEQRVRRTGNGVSPSIVGRQTAQNIPNISEQKKDEEMDLGAIMGGLTQAVDIYGRVKDIQRGTAAAPGGAGVGDFRDMYRDQFQTQVGYSPAYLGAVTPFVGGAASMGSKIGTAIAGLGLGLAADEIGVIAGVCSKVKSRRRRRRLATHSDIKDLAALKAILGSGKAFDTWIATRKM